MLALKILGFVFLIAGFVTVFSAKSLVAKFNLDRNTKCEFENEMTEDELKKYKFDRATVNLKMTGMLAAVPGLVLVLLMFK